LPVELSYEVDAWDEFARTLNLFASRRRPAPPILQQLTERPRATGFFYFQARSLDAQEQLLNSTVQYYEQALQLNVARFQGGVGSEVEVEQAKTQLETTRAQQST